MSGTSDTARQTALVAALQWGLVQAFVLASVGKGLINYYLLTDSAPPGWVTSIQFATPLAFLVGAYGGYRWITGGTGARTAETHRARSRFAGTVLVGWTLAGLPALVLQSVIALQRTVLFVLLPVTMTAVVLGAAYWVGYRLSGGRYARHRGRLLPAAQGALVGVLGGFAAFVGYGAYLRATRTSYSLDGGPIILTGVTLGVSVGAALADRLDSGRAAEFIVVLVCGSVTLGFLSTILSYAATAVGISLQLMTPSLLTLLPMTVPLLALLLAIYLTYIARTDLHRRLVATT